MDHRARLGRRCCRHCPQHASISSDSPLNLICICKTGFSLFTSAWQSQCCKQLKTGFARLTRCRVNCRPRLGIYSSAPGRNKSRRDRMARKGFFAGKGISLFVMAVVALLFAGWTAAHDKDWPVPPEAAKVKNPIAPTPDNLAAARAIYMDKCANCNGEKGSGD